MFIELTDHLRCPVDHDEQFLVLLPDAVERRRVERGELGCPVCGRVYHVVDGVADFGDAPAVEPSAAQLDGAALAALLGLGGPGGYLVLVGSVATGWRELVAALPGVAVVALDPPADFDATGAGPELSVVRASSIPLKRRSMRAVALGRRFGGDERWVAEAARVTLPGLRVIGEGEPPVHPGLRLLATAGGWWVSEREGTQ
jgi:uncharacterized protein YbaR (Trm112 family)